MLTRHIALVSAAGGVNLSDLARVSAALQKQASNDFGPMWGVTATVDAFPQLEDVPTGYWPIVVGLPDLGLEAGVHLDENGQPYALVELTGCWSFAASRACLDMLVNPSGDRTVTAPSPRAGQGSAEMLVEVCSPCGDPSLAYPVNGILVSDFCTPAFYGAAAPSLDRVTFRHALSEPFELPRGGRLVWRDSITNKWWLRTRPQDEPVDTELGVAEHGLASVRELVRAGEPRGMRTAGHALQLLEDRTRLLEHQEAVASRARAYRLRALLAKRLLRGPERPPVLLTEQRVRATNGRAPIGVLPQERLELTTQQAASWVEDDPEGAASGVDVHSAPSRVAGVEDGGLAAPRMDAQSSLAAASLASQPWPAVGASSVANEPAQCPSIAPVFAAAQPVSGGFERGTRWLAGVALVGAALFLGFGLGGRFKAASEPQSQGSPVPAPSAAAARAPQVTLPPQPEPASVAAPPPAAVQPSMVAAAPAVSQPSPEAADVPAELTKPDEPPRTKRQAMASGDSAGERVGAGQSARSIEELIETRR